MPVDIVNAVVGLYKLAGTFRADPRYAGDTVGGVALNGLYLYHFFWRYAIGFHDFRLVVKCDLRLSHFS